MSPLKPFPWLRLFFAFALLPALGGMRAGLRAAGSPPDAPQDLRVNDLADPVGTGPDVYFGWMVRDSDRDEVQTRYQLLVATSVERLAPDRADVWDSGVVAGSSQNHVAYAGPSLQSGRRYFWRVRTWDREGQAGAWSAPARFDTGLFANADWAEARWIRRESNDADDYTYFRRKVHLPAVAITRAIVYLSATHRYELRVNGGLVGRGPAYQHPQYQYYHAHDVTALLKPGAENQLAVFTHWFGGGQGRPAGERGLILKLVVEHADGTESVLGSDGSWRQSRADAWIGDDLVHRNRGEGVGYVERVDARKLRSDWAEAGFDDTAWSAAAVVGGHPVAPWTGALTPDLTRIDEREIAPASVRDLGDGGYLVDLGKIHAGRPKVRFSGGAPGTVVAMRGADTLPSSGRLPPGAKSQATVMEYQAILDGGEFVFEPVEYLGMRYFQIDGAPMPVTTENFSYVTRHSRLDDLASDFASADATLDSVWELMKHSLFTCAQEQFVDTPTREKGGFLLDGASQSTAAMPVLRERVLTRRALNEFFRSMEQHWIKPSDRGRVNAVYPNRDGARDIPDFTQAFPVWVWNYYLETGDLALLREHYSRLKDIGDYLARHIDPATGLVKNLTGGSGAYKFGIIDWPAPMRYGFDMATVARAPINGRAFAAFDVLARMAAALGQNADRAAWRARADELGSVINARLLSSAGLYVDGLTGDGSPSAHASQHANVFPLALGLVPEANRAAVIDLVCGQGMAVGMVTVEWLVRALGEADQGPALFDLFTNPSQPGWARSLARGATATWESWNSDTVPDESLSHAWGAVGLVGYVRYVLGVRPLEAQYERVLIKPLDFGDRLPWARGRISTDRGEISVAWKRAEAGYELRIKLPVNVTADIELPAGVSGAPQVTLDGEAVAAKRRGDRLVISGVGSGERTLVRVDRG